jgi:hypothetical protein
MELTFECPQCGTVGHAGDVESSAALECRACAWKRPVARETFEGGLAACPVCATKDLYVQKDFPHALGLGIVVAGFVVSTIFYYYYMTISALAVLLATAALDLVLYYIVPNVTICYRCLSQVRGVGSNPEGRFATFDLAIGERYRQERLRVEELRQRRESAGPVPPP